MTFDASAWQGTLAALLVTTATGPAQRPAHSDELDPPVRIEADGAFIDTGDAIGHSGPLVTDLDGDGLPDLLVGSFRGEIRVFHNTGTRTAPSFEEEGLLEAGGEPIRIHNW